MPCYERSVEVEAPAERVWRIVSDIDNEPFYWYGTKSVQNVSKHGDTVERVIVQNFMNRRIAQRVTIREREWVRVDYLKGVTVGTKLVSLESLDPGRQVVRVRWDIRFTGFLRLASPIIGRHVVRGTENALERIKDESEGRAAVEGRAVAAANAG